MKKVDFICFKCLRAIKETPQHLKLAWLFAELKSKPWTVLHQTSYHSDTSHSAQVVSGLRQHFPSSDTSGSSGPGAGFT